MKNNKPYLGILNQPILKERWVGIANIETRYNNLDIRFGSHFSDKVTVFSGGFGIRLGILDLHYGIQVGSQHLGIPQMIDLSLRLPGSESICNHNVKNID